MLLPVTLVFYICMSVRRPVSPVFFNVLNSSKLVFGLLCPINLKAFFYRLECFDLYVPASLILGNVKSFAFSLSDDFAAQVIRNGVLYMVFKMISFDRFHSFLICSIVWFRYLFRSLIFFACTWSYSSQSSVVWRLYRFSGILYSLCAI